MQVPRALLLTCWTATLQVASAASELPWKQQEKVMDGVNWPPSRDQRSNHVKVSIFLCDVYEFDEENGIIFVNAAMEVTWKDPRWFNAQFAEGFEVCTRPGSLCTKDDWADMLTWSGGKVASALFGSSAAVFLESARNFAGQLGSGSGQTPWIAVPPQLRLKTGSNPLGKTEFDPIIYSANPMEGELVAIWMDTAKTWFSVELSYPLFPFDRQNLSLCIPFDYFSDPHLTLDLHDRAHHGYTLEEAIKTRATKWDRASSLSPFASERFVNAFADLGFRVVSIEGMEHKSGGFSSAVCLEVIVARQISIFLLRFFLPLFMLLFIPFAGFWIPIHLVMPRVATGFISFLSLQVFRSLAYTLIPQKTSSLLWVDVTMFCVTEIMFSAVMENVIAQAMRARISNLTAVYVDSVARVSFPSLSVLTMATLFGMGAAGIDPGWLMVASQSIFFVWLLFFVTSVLQYVRALPKKLMHILIDQISRADHHYRAAVELDRMELATVFRVFDADGTGSVTGQEVIETFVQFGLTFESEAENNRFKEDIRHAWKAQGTDHLDLDGFCKNFGQLFRRRLEEAQVEPGTLSSQPASAEEVQVDIDDDEDENEQSRKF